jgi:recombinational DNA repair protein RecR
VPRPATPGALASLSDPDLCQLCTQEGVDPTGTLSCVEQIKDIIIIRRVWTFTCSARPARQTRW